MSSLTILALRSIIAIALAGSLLVQLVLVPLMWIDLDNEPAAVRVPLVAIVVLGIGALQVIAVCIWKLLTMVRRGTVFSPAAFRYVDLVIGALATGACLVFSIAVVLAPGDDVAPGLVGLICGLSLVAGGVALVVLVQRMLLRQAVDLATETQQLHAELSEVI